MKFHRRLFASVLILLLSPMAANATLITYISNPFTSGQYLTAEVEIADAAPGVYSRNNGGLLSYMLDLFDSSDNLVGSLSSASNQSFYNDYVRLDTNGNLDVWFLYLNNSSSPGHQYYTLNHYDDSLGGFGGSTTNPKVEDVAGLSRSASISNFNNVGAWSAEVPEPGTLALLAVGIGFMYRRKIVGGRV